MTGRELFLEIGNIREEFVAEAENYQSETKGNILTVISGKTAKSVTFRKTLATAACLVVCAGLVFTVQKLGISKDTAKESAMENEMVMETAREELWDVAEKQEDALPEAESSIVTDEEFGLGTPEKTNGMKDELKSEVAKEEQLGTALQMDNMFVLVHGTVEKGQHLWDAFLESVDAGKPAQVEIVRFTVEGDPIIETVHYDGEIFYLCVDNSRDAYRGNGDKYFEAKYSQLVKEENTLDAGGRTIEYFLTDGENKYSIVYISE